MAETRTPILLLSDAVTAGTGLARITKDLATRMYASLSDICEVATVGYGGTYDRSLGFPQYTIEPPRDWIIPQLPQVWQNFAGDRKGVLMTIWDASRLGWFSQPHHPDMARVLDPGLRQWLTAAPFKRWGYFPVDAEAFDGKLPYPTTHILGGFDRILAYGKWAEGVIRKTMSAGGYDIEHLPHGIDGDVFFETNRKNCRQMFMKITGAKTLMGQRPYPVEKNQLLAGIVATNQPRKDWALGLQTIAELKKTHKVRVWIHADEMEKHWSIPSLLVDLNLLDEAMVSLGFLTDERMAEAYSACDVTLGIGAGEGFGLPLLESMFCGTPCVHGNYAGAPEWMGSETLVEPVAYRYEGVYTCKRPVFDPKDWAKKVLEVKDYRMNRPGDVDWSNLWPRWEKWLRDGIQMRGKN